MNNNLVKMVNNPFRSKPSTNIRQNVDDWGTTKFKPTKFGSGGTNNKKSFNQKGNNNRRNKGASKFNEVANNAKPENATPWNKYKDELVFKQREEEQTTLQANVDSKKLKMVLKQREINYRKSLVQQKMQEAVKWEDFGDEEQNDQDDKAKSNKFTRNSTSEKNLNKFHKPAYSNKKRNSTNKVDKQSKTIKKHVLSMDFKSDPQQFISKKLLENFDSKKLNYKQNDKLRGTITKTVMMAPGGNSLQMVVKDMKRKGLKKERSYKK